MKNSKKLYLSFFLFVVLFIPILATYYGEVSNSAKNTNTLLSRIRAYQRALAIDEIARQKGVKVDSKLEYYTEKIADDVRSGLSSYSIKTTNGVNMRAKIVDVYYDKKDIKFYVLMCAY